MNLLCHSLQWSWVTAGVRFWLARTYPLQWREMPCHGAVAVVAIYRVEDWFEQLRLYSAMASPVRDQGNSPWISCYAVKSSDRKGASIRLHPPLEPSRAFWEVALNALLCRYLRSGQEGHEWAHLRNEHELGKNPERIWNEHISGLRQETTNTN